MDALDLQGCLYQKLYNVRVVQAPLGDWIVKKMGGTGKPNSPFKLVPLSGENYFEPRPENEILITFSGSFKKFPNSKLIFEFRDFFQNLR